MPPFLSIFSISDESQPLERWIYNKEFFHNYSKKFELMLSSACREFKVEYSEEFSNISTQCNGNLLFCVVQWRRRSHDEKWQKREREREEIIVNSMWCAAFYGGARCFHCYHHDSRKKASLINSAFCCSPLMLVRFHSYKVHTIRTAASSEDETWAYRKYIYGEEKKTHRRLSEGGEIFLILLIFLIFMWVWRRKAQNSSAKSSHRIVTTTVGWLRKNSPYTSFINVVAWWWQTWVYED